MQIPRRKRTWRWLISVFLGVVAVGVVLWQSDLLTAISGTAGTSDADSTRVALSDSGDQKQAEEPEEIPVPVELARVERRAIAAFYRAASVVEADRLVDVVVRIAGRIQTLNVEEGDWVRKGDILAEIENGRERVQQRQAELRLEEQRRLLERNEAMLAEDLVSRQVYDDAKSAHDLAEADRDLARIAVEETIIRAPFAGQVTERRVVLGQQVAVTTPLFTLADFEPLRVRIHLPETIARKVAVGQRVLVTAEAAAEPLPGKVERISPVVDPATSTVRLTLLLEGGARSARVGGFVKVRVTTETHTEALTVPKIALVEEGGLRNVFVAAADSVRKVEINTGLYDESHVEVLDGLVAGDFVVVLGQGGLRTGSKIEALNAVAVDWPSASGPAAGGETSGQVALTPDD